MKILVLDNYDSFTYNLVHIIKNTLPQAQTDVFRNDEIELSAVNNYDKVLLSPGPNLPVNAGILLPLIKTYAAQKSILGVCLGMQAIAEAFGGTLQNISEVFHGVATDIYQTENSDILYENIPKIFQAGRYHSWVVEKNNLPADFLITAEDKSGQIMSIKHQSFDLKGVQFHPESILTPLGSQMISNWLR